jgi:hypothetical protein
MAKRCLPYEDFLEVVLCHNHRHRNDERQPVRTAQFTLIHLLTHQHIDGDPQTGRRDTRRIGNSNRLEVGIFLQALIPQLQELAASFANQNRPFRRVRRHYCLHRADCHTILRPVAVEIRERRQKFDMTC